MIKKIILFILMAMLAAVGSSCSSEEEKQESNDRNPISLTAGERGAANQLNVFSYNYTRDFCKYLDGKEDLTNKNMVCSPLGAEIVMTLIANGIALDDRNELLNYLNVADTETLNSLNKTLLTHLPEADKTATLKLADALWINTIGGISLTDEFKSTSGLYYDCGINKGNFSTEQESLLREMNSWVASQTNGIYCSYIDKLNPSTLAIVMNTLYFNARWKNDLFKPENTTKGLFYGVDKTTEVDMMQSKRVASHYAEDDIFEYFYLGFGNGAYNMIILYPKEGVEMDTALSQLTYEKEEELNASDYRVELMVRMPKFSIASELDISGMLDAVLPDGFAGSMDFQMFSPAISGDVDLKQNVRLNVDEKGAEAASVTTGSIGMLAPERIEKDVTLDRPFFFFIREYSTGTNILAGRVCDF